MASASASSIMDQGWEEKHLKYWGKPEEWGDETLKSNTDTARLIMDDFRKVYDRMAKPLFDADDDPEISLKAGAALQYLSEEFTKIQVMVDNFPPPKQDLQSDLIEFLAMMNKLDKFCRDNNVHTDDSVELFFQE